jgi:hypothetical protein
MFVGTYQWEQFKPLEQIGSSPHLIDQLKKKKLPTKISTFEIY